MTERVFVRWTGELQQAFNTLARRMGSAGAARALHMPERNLHDYRHGLSRKGYKGGRVCPRKFLSVDVLNRLADALDDPLLTSREALTQREWCDRGEWDYFKQEAIANG